MAAAGGQVFATSCVWRTAPFAGTTSTRSRWLRPGRRGRREWPGALLRRASSRHVSQRDHIRRGRALRSSRARHRGSQRCHRRLRDRLPGSRAHGRAAGTPGGGWNRGRSPFLRSLRRPADRAGRGRRKPRGDRCPRSGEHGRGLGPRHRRRHRGRERRLHPDSLRRARSRVPGGSRHAGQPAPRHGQHPHARRGRAHRKPACSRAICWWQPKEARTRSLSAAAGRARSAASPRGPRWLTPRDTSSSRAWVEHWPLRLPALTEGLPSSPIGAGSSCGPQLAAARQLTRPARLRWSARPRG
jgi:hypothetical protein